jgi:hypothetical protein
MPLLRAALLLVSTSAREDFPEAACAEISVNPATPVKAIEEACASELSLTSGQCDFFSEAWSLAITHPGFKPEVFCHAVGGAFKCSRMMDAVLTSGAVSDLAFAACVREQGVENTKYCQQFQSTIGEADHTTDLDTLRACYLLEEEGKTSAGPILSRVPPRNTSNTFGNGSATPPQPLLANSTSARPFGMRTEKSTIPEEPPRITVEPMHGVRPNGSNYEPHHIVAGDGPLQSVGEGTPAKIPIPAVPPPTRQEIAVGAGTEAGGLAGATAGAAAGKEAGFDAGTAAGEEAGMAVAANTSIPRHEVEAAAYKAGFEAGKAEGSSVTALVNVNSSTTVPKAEATSRSVEAAHVLRKAAVRKSVEAVTAAKVVKPVGAVKVVEAVKPVKVVKKASEPRTAGAHTEDHAGKKVATGGAKTGKTVAATQESKASGKEVQRAKGKEEDKGKGKEEVKGKEEKGKEEEKTLPYSGFLTKFYTVS